MSWLDDIPTWTFAGVDLPLETSSDSWELWFARVATRKVDQIIDGGVYVDLSSEPAYPPLTKLATFESYSALQAMVTKWGQSGTLVGLQGQSAVALLAEIRELGTSSGRWLAECVFEWVS